MRLSSSFKKCFLQISIVAISLTFVIFISAESFSVKKPEISSKKEIMQLIERDILAKIPKNYFLKKNQIQSLLNNYSLKELKAIYQDYFLLKSITFEKALKDQKPRLYVVTAGAPDAGKSTILEKFLNAHKGYAYIDPDRTCLLEMENTYKKDIECNKTPQYAYTKWRDASNFIANVLMCHALEKGYNLAHGATLAAADRISELVALKNYGYFRKILHINCPDDIRFASEKARRARGIVQCSDDDLINKGKWFFHRFDDYLKNAEVIDFYYRGDMTTVKKAATKTSNKIDILDVKSFNKIKNMHSVALQDKNYWKRYSQSPFPKGKGLNREDQGQLVD